MTVTLEACQYDDDTFFVLQQQIFAPMLCYFQLKVPVNRPKCQAQGLALKLHKVFSLQNVLVFALPVWNTLYALSIQQLSILVINNWLMWNFHMMNQHTLRESTKLQRCG